MKSNLLRIFIEWALITSVLTSVGFFVWYWVASHGVRVCESQIAVANDQFQKSQFVMKNLGDDCGEYAKTNADFARLLAFLTAPPSPAAASAKPKNTGIR